MPLLAWDAHVLVFCDLVNWPAVCALLAPLVPVQELLVWYRDQASSDRAAPGRSRGGDTRVPKSRAVIVHATMASRTKADSATTHPGLAPIVSSTGWNRTAGPVELMGDLVGRYCVPDALVLDPFARCGSTLVAAQRRGRRAVGIERDARLVAIAIQRLRRQLLSSVTC